MNRRAIMLTAFCTIGLVVNIGVAWIGALRVEASQYKPVNPRTNGWTWSQERPFTWPDGVPDKWRSPKREVRTSSAMATRHVLISDSWGVTSGNPFKFLSGILEWRLLKCGWPFRSMMCERFSTGNTGPLGVGWNTKLEPMSTWRGGIYLPTGVISTLKLPGDQLPLRPIWPGFAFNTFLFASASFLLWLTPRALLRANRRRRGRCGYCGYDVHGISVCPECGHHLRKRASGTLPS